MNLKTALPLIYLIVITIVLVFIFSMLWDASKREPSLRVVSDVVQSILALFLFALIASFTQASDIARGIVRNRWLIVLSFFISIIGGIVGYLLYDTIAPFITPQLERLREQAQQMESMSHNLFPVFIFANNARVSSMTGLLFGSIPFGGFFSPFMLFVNGALIGFIAHLPTSSVPLLLAGLVPHGILEIPALYLASAVGLRINISIFRGAYLLWKNDEERAGREMEHALEAGKLFALIIPLLLVAALVESYITPLVLKWVGF